MPNFTAMTIGQALVNCALNTAVENGYGNDLDELDAVGIANDLIGYHESFEGEEPADLLPRIEVWKEERRIAKAEMGEPDG